jgi:hypothetical protein
MAKVRRFSGDLKMELSFNDRSSKYRVRICPMVKGEPCETVYVKPPAAGARGSRGVAMAVDSPRAYDHAARAAISFSRNSIQEHAAGDARGWTITKPRRNQ